MDLNVTQKLLTHHLASGSLQAGDEIAIRIDQTLTQDATGTLVMLALEAMGVDRIKTKRSVQYVDHNLVQEDFKNADDHRFLLSACRRYGVWFSPPGNGISHAVHMERFGVPGATLLGSDSHTPAAGALGMLAIGAGGLEVALAMTGRPFYLRMPKIWGVRLEGELPPWVSAKDAILEMLRRHDVHGGVGRVIEYYGPGLRCLSVMDRHVLANMGTELGATSTVFPSDDNVRAFLASYGREEDWTELLADEHAEYDAYEVLDLSKIEPMVAQPSSPGNVTRVADIAGRPVAQAYIGSSANPGFRDFAIAAEIVRKTHVPPGVSFDINPSSRDVLERLTRSGDLASLIQAGARIHQAGCNGCIGMGQAPATETNSLRTVPRNFPGRSGTREDNVYLVSPETAAASALRGRITDPRSAETPYRKVEEPGPNATADDLFVAPLPQEQARSVELLKGPNIRTLPELDPLPESLTLRVVLKAPDNVSTDEILPAGTRVLPLRSNIPAISQFTFEGVDPHYAEHATDMERGDHAVIGGHNYGQGSSREHAALAPRYLGLRVVVAKSFARIHMRNLVNYGVLPLKFEKESDYDRISPGVGLTLRDVHMQLKTNSVCVELNEAGSVIRTSHSLSPRQVAIVRAGGMFAWIRRQE